MGNTESVGGRAVVTLSLNELEDRIKRAKITGTLDLSHQGIATFPHEILQLKGKITSLSCNYNSISRIPDGLAASMVTLTRIELQSNWLTTLPPDFGQLTNLEILDLSYNMLSALPDSLGEFRRLKELDVGWNKIQYLPASLLPKIASLKKLNLQGNFLTALPQEIGQLSILTSLNLRNNKLQLLPPEIGKLRQLTDINLIENHLTYLPPEFGELKDLLRLLIFDNKIDTIPVEVAKLPSLANVDMSNNRLDRLFYPPVFDSSAALPATDINTGAAEENGWKKKSRKKDQKSDNGAAPSEAGSSSGGGGGSSRKKRKKQPTDDVAASPAKGRRAKGEATDGGAGEQKPAADGAAPKESEKEKEKEKPKANAKEKEKEKADGEEGEEEGESDEFSGRRQIDLERELDRERAKQQESQEEEQDDPVKWKRVQRLHITNNLLTEVPMSIARAMKGLKVLCLQHNAIRHIPRELGLLKYLETIDLSYNQLEDLPIELAQLPLKILYVTNNRLRYTETLERMCGGLLSLQEIHLGANQLKQIPQSLAKLEFLTYINLYQNFVTVLPDSFEDLPSFCEPRPEIGSSSRQLILSYNRFETFPPQLLKLRCLHELHFSGNAVPEIPDEIKNLSRLMLLSLGNNRIPLKLPESLGELASLERLYLRGTQLANVPTSLRKLIPRLIEIDVSPDTVLPSGTEGADDNAGSDIQKKDKAEAAGAEASGSGEASGEKPNKENGNGDAAQQEGGEKAAPTPAAADDEAAPASAASGGDAAASSNETPESARRGKKNKDKAEAADKSESEASSSSSKNEGEPKASAESGAAESGGEDSKKSDRQRRKEKEKEEKKAKKQKNKDEKRSKGGRFLQRFKGGDGEKKGNNGSGGKGDGSGEGRGKGGDQGSKKVPKRPRLPKDWPLYITPNEEGTPSKRFAFGCAKMIGLGRKNEDTLMVRSSLTGRDDEDYFAVFDGHGGKHASRFAADNLHTILSEQLALSPSDPEGALRRSFAEVHQRMLTYFQKSNLREECGCTAIVSLIVGNTVYVAGAGDSRAVFCYGNQVQRVSLDHKPYLEEESRRVRAVGGLVKVDSDYAKQYRVCKLFAGGGFGGLAVSRALGDFSWSPQVVEEPTIMTIQLPSKAAASPAPLKSSREKEKKKVVEDDDDDAKHAYLILACDGVWDVLSDEESAAIAMKERNALTAAVRIREHSYYLGSGDDICAVVVRLL